MQVRRRCRPGRRGAEYFSSGRRLWDARSFIRIHCKENHYGPLAVQRLSDGFPASAGRVNFRLDSQFSGRRLWDTPFVLRIYLETYDFRRPAVQGPPGGFQASTGRVGRWLDSRFRAGGLEMLRPYPNFIQKPLILGLRLGRHMNLCT